MSSRERDFQKELIKKIKKMFPGAYVLKNDPNYIRGIPDLLILYNNRWAMLECKASSAARHEDTSTIMAQEYYVNQLNEMSFAAFIYPENEEEILSDLQQSLLS